LSLATSPPHTHTHTHTNTVAAVIASPPPAPPSRPLSQAAGQQEVCSCFVISSLEGKVECKKMKEPGRLRAGPSSCASHATPRNARLSSATWTGGRSFKRKHCGNSVSIVKTSLFRAHAPLWAHVWSNYNKKSLQRL